MDISTLFSLPAHPLLVHIPIVLIPLVSLAGIAMALVPRWRRPYGPITVVLAGVALVGVQLAIGSGQSLESHVPRSRLLEDHTSMAESLRPLAALLFVALLALVMVDRYGPKRRDEPESESPAGRRGSRWLPTAMASLTVVAAVLASTRLVQVGHSGAKATWSTTNMSSQPRRAAP
jgi:hypothetical protein